MRDRRAADECEELAPFYLIELHSLPRARNLWQHNTLARIKSGVLRCEILGPPMSAWGQTRPFDDVGSSVRFARKRTRLDDL